MGDVDDWNRRYRAGEHQSAEPSAFVREVAERLAPGRALDLACGAGRHALFLAERGWEVVAVDGSSVALEILAQRATPAIAPRLHTRCVDLEREPLHLDPASFDLVLDAFYLQRALFPELAAAVRLGGHFAAAIHLGGEGQPRRVKPGELRGFFPGWTVLVDRELAPPGDKPSAQLLVEKPRQP